jgi:MFS family permease
LAFGSPLLVGGKVGDLFGRKWTNRRVGGFPAASAVGGLAPCTMLVAARATQGVWRAAAPSALSLLICHVR